MYNGSNITTYGDNNNTSYWVEFNQDTGLLTMTNEENRGCYWVTTIIILMGMIPKWR